MNSQWQALQEGHRLNKLRAQQLLNMDRKGDRRRVGVGGWGNLVVLVAGAWHRTPGLIV